MQEKLRIFLVDDNALLRDALRTVVDSQPDMVVVGEAADGAEALEKAIPLAPQLVLIDVRMPGMSGEETVSILRKSLPQAQIIALSASEDQRSKMRMLEAGANAYLPKSINPNAMLAAIRSAGAGTSTLTSQEMEVLKRFASGYPMREIAQAVSLDLPTAEQCREEGMRKLKATSRAEVARIAAEQGWA